MLLLSRDSQDVDRSLRLWNLSTGTYSSYSKLIDSTENNSFCLLSRSWYSDFYTGRTRNGGPAIRERPLSVGGFGGLCWFNPFKINSTFARSARLRLTSASWPYFPSFPSQFLSIFCFHGFGWLSDCYAITGTRLQELHSLLFRWWNGPSFQIVPCPVQDQSE